MFTQAQHQQLVQQPVLWLGLPGDLRFVDCHDYRPERKSSFGEEEQDYGF